MAFGIRSRLLRLRNAKAKGQNVKALVLKDRKIRSQMRKKIFGVVSIAMLGVIMAVAFLRAHADYKNGIDLPIEHGQRRLASGSVTCDAAIIGQYGMAVVYLFIVLYFFVGLAIVCDDFFVPALEIISETLNLTEDVAGATFLAAGSSAPELFTSMADMFNASEGNPSGMGIGTIVGSAMFNILIIVAMAAAATTETLTIDWRPIARDAGFYSFSILLMVVFMITGEQVEWWEGLIMTLCYGLYILFMVFNAKIFAKCKPKDKVHIIDAEKLGEIEKGIEKMTEDHQAKVKAAEQAIDKEQVSLTNEEATPTGDAEEEDDENKWAWPDNLPDRVWFILAFIYQCLFTVTIPPCEDDKWKKWYIVSFINSIIWIGALCLGMVFFATKIGCILEISPPVMGIVVLAVGTSVPDALGSMIVARNGEADMAIANAVGSNVFDILLGLGIPWFLNEFVHGTVVKTDLGGIGIAIGILYATVLIFVGTIVLNKFQMNSNIGKVFCATYVLYIAYTLMAEYCLIPVNKGC